MKTLGQIAYENHFMHASGPLKWRDIHPQDAEKWERMASAVATEAVERFKASLAEQSGEPLGKTAAEGFYQTVFSSLDRIDLLERWNAAALAVKARVLAEMEANVVSDANRAAGHDVPKFSFRPQLGDAVSHGRNVAMERELMEKLLNPPMIVSADADGRTHIQKPEPSLLEVAAMIYARYRGELNAPADAVDEAAELIAAVREHEKASK